MKNAARDTSAPMLIKTTFEVLIELSVSKDVSDGLEAKNLRTMVVPTRGIPIASSIR